MLIHLRYWKFSFRLQTNANFIKWDLILIALVFVWIITLVLHINYNLHINKNE